MQNLQDFASQHSIRYFLISYTDLFGAQRSKLVPTEAIADMQRDGAGFAGFATWLDMTPAHPDMFAVPDPSSAVPLPWKPGIAWVAADLFMSGQALEQGPRIVLKRVLEQMAEKGHYVKTGVEAEYMLISSDGTAIGDAMDTAIKPCYDQQALLRRCDVITEICDYMLQLGWEPYQNDHEDANGQFEMNWGFSDALVTADRHSFFKFMVKSVAEKHGLRATFMPKPFTHLTGNGCHVHLSAWSQDGRQNHFLDSNHELGLSQHALHFMAGVLHHARSLVALTNPTVNSYKRINAPVTVSGATWAPNTVSWSGNNRTHMIRIPDGGRMEIRLADGAANPYLLQAALIAAGYDGIQQQLDPGPRLDLDMYAEGHTLQDVTKLPLNLLDALRCLEQDQALIEAMGHSFSHSFLKLKYQEWDRYAAHLTDWERANALDI